MSSTTPIPVKRRGRLYSGGGGFPPAPTGSTGPPPGYVAPAVHFDGMTWNVNSSLVATDTNVLSLSYWFKNDTAGSGTFSNMNAGLIFVVDPENNYTTFVDNLTSGTNIQVSMENVAGALGVNTNAPVFPTSVDTDWHHLLFSGETGQAGSNARKIYFDDVDITVLMSDQGPFQMVFNGKSFWFGADNFGGGQGSGILGDIADVWIAPNVSLLTAGDIPTINRRIFIDASLKPVNPSGFPSSAVLFSGDHTTFPDNQGLGGPFVLTGTLTDASTHP